MRTLLWILAIGSLALTGCSAQYSRVDTGGSARAGTHLDSGKSVLVAVPADGSYDGKSYAGSGQMVAQRTAAAFTPHAKRVEIAPAKLDDRERLLAAGRNAGAGYLIIPSIAHWEPRATEWSGRPSRASIGMAIVDVSTGKDLTSALLESRSRIVSWTGTSPESLLPHLVGEYADGLY